MAIAANPIQARGRATMVDVIGFWPLPIIQRGSLVTKAQPVESMPNRALRVVVVEDNYDANAALSRLLEKSGFEVAGRAYDGASGLTCIKSEKPDVAILDIAMPVLDGYALARRIRDEIDSPPHLVALTGFGKESDQGKALSAGFDAYFRKPADWRALKAVLDSYALH
jgi:DNA-binding response OmpR family regulator